IYNYPYAAVEEALCNAVYHKSYQIGEPVTVMITPEKMEITSLPGPDRTITDEDLRNNHLVSKRYRNRRIGDFLKELKLIEGRNTGIPTILRALKNNGSEAPVFETDEERSFFTITIPVNKEFLLPKEEPKTVAKKDNASAKSRRKPSEIKQLILKVLSAEGALSKAELVDKMNYKKLTDSVSNAIAELIAEKKIKYTEDKLNSKNQKLIIL
ncbi:MAG: AAA family ATPase, partial [Spirochaetia bacterium]|nr:AAA family ATPase [Spirochaetia bacterium]